MIREQSSATSIPWRLTECRSFWCLIDVCAFIAWMIAAIWPGTAAGSYSWRVQSCAVALHMVLILMTAGDIEQLALRKQYSVEPQHQRCRKVSVANSISCTSIASSACAQWE